MDQKYIELALLNIERFGDTDIFPVTIEKQVFSDCKLEVIDYIQKIDNNCFDILNKLPPVNISTFSPLGFTGFRWATQIDPIWNAYFLSLVLSISDNIERDKIQNEKKVIHSYRFSPDYENGTLFDNNTNWQSFQTHSIEIAKNSDYQFVVSCDIADYYGRIYHHKLENALLRLGITNDSPKKIVKILQKFSGTNSYGLPIGGPAARILAELALNNTDKILQMNGIKFIRFVDDIYIFSKTQEQAHASLNYLAIKLMTNEGLSLQKHKTQILSKTEFVNLISSRVNSESEEGKAKIRTKFMSLPIRFDPYSPTADIDYKKIQKELNEFDILDLLNEELRKTRIHQQFSKHLLKTLNVLEDKIVSNAFLAITDKFELLYPIFPNLMVAAFINFEKLEEKSKNQLINKLRELVVNDSYIIQIELNTTLLIRVLGKHHTNENEEILAHLYKKYQNSILVKSWIMQVFTNWKLLFWLSDQKQNFPTMSKWERRIFIIASYFMKDEGKHWREHNKQGFSDFEKIVSNWASMQKEKNLNWNIIL